MNTENTERILGALFGVIVMIGVGIFVALSSDDSEAGPLVFYAGDFYGDCQEVGGYMLRCDGGIVKNPPANIPVVMYHDEGWAYKGVAYGRCGIATVIETATGRTWQRLECFSYYDD